jgi:hypothetical protein
LVAIFGGVSFFAQTYDVRVGMLEEVIFSGGKDSDCTVFKVNETKKVCDF